MLQFVANGVVVGSILAVTAVGLTIIYGILRLINFAHGDMVTVGAYTAWFMNAHYQWNQLMSIPLAFVVGAAVGVLSEKLIWQRMRRMKAGIVSLIVASIGLALVIRHVIVFYFGAGTKSFRIPVQRAAPVFDWLPAVRLSPNQVAIIIVAAVLVLALHTELWLTRGPQGMFGFPLPFAGYGFTHLGNRTALLILSLALLVVVFILIEYLTRSPWGRVLKAIREDEDVALALGKNTRSYKIQSLALGSAIAGLAGVLMAFFLRFISPGQFEAIKTFEAWMMMILGGSGNNWGSVLGAFIFRFVDTTTRQFDLGSWVGLSTRQVAAARQILVGLVLILLMMYRPQGILGKKEELTLER